MLLFRDFAVLVFTVGVYFGEISGDDVSADLMEPMFSFWPQKSLGVSSGRILKRDTLPGQTEGGQVLPTDKKDEQQVTSNDVKATEKPIIAKVPDKLSILTETTVAPSIKNDTKNNTTSTEDPLDLTKPGVVKRGLIVFGGFALLAIAYFIFYRRKSNKNDNLNIHNTPDSLQFRYGVLESNDRDNLELSRVPLTMESDDDDDDDLEIFDLEQKKKSLSYVNLKSQDDTQLFNIGNDTAIVMDDDDDDKEQLLLDIDDKNSDTLINLTGQSRKSINML